MTSTADRWMASPSETLSTQGEPVRVIDLFAGPGGWDVAARDLGLEVLGIEFDHAACETRRAAGLSTIEGDVRDHRTLATAGYDGLIASPPCQTFSTAGKGAGRAALDDVLLGVKTLASRQPFDPSVFDDERTGLVLEPLLWALTAIDAGKPFQWIALEQVPTVLPVWEAYAEVLRAEGYSVATGNLQAEQYGVPQTRKRAVLVARLNGEAALPTPTHSKYYNRTPGKLDPGVLPWVSMAEALGWTGFVQEAQTGMGALARQGRTERPIRTEDQPSFTITASGKDHTGKMGGCARLRMVYVNGNQANAARRPDDKPAPTVHFGAAMNDVRWITGQARNSGPGAARAPRALDEPSYTIRANGSGSHPSGTEWAGDSSTRVTVTEAAILQSFSECYPWQGSKTKQYQQVGNAVPPLLARAILQTLSTQGETEAVL